MLMLFSCGKHPVPDELTEAEKLMQSHPDSALQILESVSNPEAMPKAHYAEYCLLLTEARDKNYYTFTSDSVIRVAAEYYESTNDSRKLPKAYYYMGRVHQEIKKIPYALEYYLKAEASAGDHFEDNRLMSRIYNSIGRIYTQLHIYDDAMHTYKKAEHYLYACQDSIGLPFVLRNMARIYQAIEKKDSAELYYQQAITLSERVQNKQALISSFTEMAGLYIRLERYDAAKGCLSQISQFVNDGELSDQAAVIYANYYQHKAQTDSALYYLNKSVQSKNSYTKAASYYQFYQIAKSTQDYKQTLDHADRYYLYRDTLTQAMEREESLRIQNLYNYQKIIREKDQLQQDRNEKYQQIVLLSFILLFSFLLIVFGFLYYKQHRRNETLLHEKQLRLKDELYRSSRKQIQKNLNQIKSLEQKLQETEQKSNRLEKIMLEKQMYLLKQDNIRIELVDESKYIKYEQFIATPIFQQLRNISPRKYMQDEIWDELKITTDRIYNPFGNKLLCLLPKISDKELKICYLIKTKFSLIEIADLVGLTASGLSQSRKRLYKKIHGTSGSGEDLDHFIDNL